MSSIKLIFIFLFSIFTANAYQKPNIVVIMADDMGFSDIGCYGGRFLHPT